MGSCSVNAPYSGGEAVTRPFTFEGKELLLNFSTSAAGGIRIEVQEPTGKPLPGYSVSDCPEIVGDEIERVVAWGGVGPGPLAGKPVRLRFVMKDADVYSIRFR